MNASFVLPVIIIAVTRADKNSNSSSSINLHHLAIQASMNSTELENSLPSNSTFVDAGESVDFRNQRTSILPTHEV